MIIYPKLVTVYNHELEEKNSDCSIKNDILLEFKSELKRFFDIDDESHCQESTNEDILLNIQNKNIMLKRAESLDWWQSNVDFKINTFSYLVEIAKEVRDFKKRLVTERFLFKASECNFCF